MGQDRDHRTYFTSGGSGSVRRFSPATPRTGARIDVIDGPDDAAPPAPRPADRGRRRATLRRMAWFASGIAAAFLALVAFRSIFPDAHPLTSRDLRDSIASALGSQTPGPGLSETSYAVIQPSLVLSQTDDCTGAAT